MSETTREDISAAVELSLDMSWAEAVKFYRDELGCTLRGGRRLLLVALADHPSSKLAASIRAHQEA